MGSRHKILKSLGVRFLSALLGADLVFGAGQNTSSTLANASSSRLLRAIAQGHPAGTVAPLIALAVRNP